MISGQAFLNLFPSTLRLKSQTCGGEWHGPCPFCGGNNRFLVQPEADDRGGRWTCRDCQNFQWRRALDYVLLRDFGGIPDKPTNYGFDDADPAVREYKRTLAKAYEVLGVPRSDAAPRVLADPEPKSCLPPSDVWQKAALGFMAYAFRHLWDVPHSDRPDHPAHAYLAGRGVSEGIAQWASVGYNPTTLRRPATKWGMDGDTMWLPAGLVFPYFVDGVLWKIVIRQEGAAGDAENKYIALKGSGNAPLGMQTVEPRRPLVLVEGAFDWLAVCQATNADAIDSTNARIGCVATGTTWARHMTWALQFHRCSAALAAHDNEPPKAGDEHSPGDKAAAWWLDVLGAKARRHLPTRKDCGAMLEAGDDIAAWITEGLQP